MAESTAKIVLPEEGTSMMPQRGRGELREKLRRLLNEENTDVLRSVIEKWDRRDDGITDRMPGDRRR